MNQQKTDPLLRTYIRYPERQKQSLSGVSAVLAPSLRMENNFAHSQKAVLFAITIEHRVLRMRTFPFVIVAFIALVSPCHAGKKPAITERKRATCIRLRRRLRSRCQTGIRCGHGQRRVKALSILVQAWPQKISCTIWRKMRVPVGHGETTK